MQRCLIHHGSRDGCFAVGLLTDRHVFEPVSPLTSQMSLDTELVDRRLGGLFSGRVRVCHDLPDLPETGDTPCAVRP